MKCPYCGGTMADGILQAGHSIIWTPKAHLISLNPRGDGNDVVLAHNPLTTAKAPAYKCDKCLKIIVEYDESDDKF